MNNTIFYFFYNFAYHSAFFDELVIFFSVYFIYIVIIASLIFLFRSSRKELILLCISGGLAYAFAKILKILMHTERPFVLFPQVTSLFLETGYAFPSGHTAVASAIAFLIYFYNKKAGYIFMLFALLIGIARIIAGVHFPVDILGGFILGALVSYLFAYFVKKI
ncbi:hypothetical protein A2W67_00070 [Candidatus Nomurabacteria bacterium RIFCSPLOWO2_02_40_28]|uniref:Bacitracin transport permease protein BCRC n=2 Tax=Candidatus Nomuraibacteriota TaxID=1752729 RepID=A0A837HV21_9BACT|nr:MAG: Bacitracin transport permease protein BCRC [Candidatus Nomurabacteria bacterium GW2011_GWD2_39_12]KKR19995.1 MAG: Bacitracin transport permease protein BCRC [Candidatus Nomurabacteria bacterium GW2011_GWC2_39_41]KKR36278.1 MAG: Bacitracin transport permease protein BCRC [Candidatus Nomurabacteria bacterium GW2011_GWE2_40_10]KKR37961.1 MAG: Bacitracin transport permease protein BCRC [Candidatus Nomurabacteria bacterium GW2011_GWB1_40_11]KKR39358.1 MAG: Bacitracin transport permease prote